MRTAFSLLLVIVIFFGCSKESVEKGPAVMEGIPQIARITQAKIAPENATSSQPVVVQYTAESAEGQPVAYTYRWYVDGGLVADVRGNMLDPQYFRKGAIVEAEIIPTDGEREGSPYRTRSITIGNTPPQALDVELSPVPAFAGVQITAVPRGEDRDGDTLSFLYQWEVDGKIIPGANGQTFDTTGVRKKSKISVEVTPFDGEERGSPVRSKYLTLSNKAPEIISMPPAGLESGKYTYQVAARDADGDALAYSLATAPQGMTINSSTGLITWEPKPGTSREEFAVKVSTSDGDGGIAYQEFSLILETR